MFLNNNFLYLFYIIRNTPSALHSVLGYGLLGPIAVSSGVAPDVKAGKDLVLWTSLAMMIGESLTSLIIIFIKMVMRFIRYIIRDNERQFVDINPITHHT